MRNRRVAVPIGVRFLHIAVRKRKEGSNKKPKGGPIKDLTGQNQTCKGKRRTALDAAISDG